MKRYFEKLKGFKPHSITKTELKKLRSLKNKQSSKLWGRIWKQVNKPLI